MVWLQTDEGSLLELLDGDIIKIGRGVDNKIQLDFKSISKNHAIITNEKKHDEIRTYIEDYDSRNGTFVGISPLELDKVNGKRLLKHNDFIQFGSLKRYFRYYTVLSENQIDMKNIHVIPRDNSSESISSKPSNNLSSYNSTSPVSRSNSRQIEFIDENLGDENELAIIPRLNNHNNSNMRYNDDMKYSTYQENSLSNQSGNLITITYPVTTQETNVNPVSIHIDSSHQNSFFDKSSSNPNINNHVDRYTTDRNFNSSLNRLPNNSQSRLQPYNPIEKANLPSNTQFLSSSQGIRKGTLQNRLTASQPILKTSTLQGLQPDLFINDYTNSSMNNLPLQMSSPYISYNASYNASGLESFIQSNSLHNRINSDSPNIANKHKVQSSNRLVLVRRKKGNINNSVVVVDDSIDYFVQRILGKIQVKSYSNQNKSYIDNLDDDPEALQTEEAYDDDQRSNRLSNAHEKRKAGKDEDEDLEYLSHTNIITKNDLNVNVQLPIPQNILTEALADLLLSPNRDEQDLNDRKSKSNVSTSSKKSVLSTLNNAITILDDLYEQMTIGSNIDELLDENPNKRLENKTDKLKSNATSDGIDEALHDLIVNMLEKSIDLIDQAISSSFVNVLSSSNGGQSPSPQPQ